MDALLNPTICKTLPLVNFNFGDRRINARANFMLKKMSKSCGKWLPEIFCSSGDLKGAYRFLNNNLVSPDKILQPHAEETVKRCIDHNTVAIIQDSSDLDYDYLKSLEGFESLHINVDKGFRIHPLLAITEEGTPLGILNTFNYTRTKGDSPKKHRNSLEIDEKESFRWLWGYREACELAKQCPNTMVVCIGDRENDIYECLSEAQNIEIPHRAEILVRSKHNRTLADSNEDTNNKLEKKLIRSSVRFEGKLDLNEYRENARKASIVIRASRVLIKAPNTCKKKKLPPVEMNAILVSEVDPPKGQEAVNWLLLTTLPIETTEEISRIISLYSKRWGIEIYFKVLKSGCKIDSVRFRTTTAIENYIALMMIIAWRVMLTTYLPRQYPNAPCTVIFTEIEWKLMYMAAHNNKKTIPEEAPTLKEAVMLLAIIGGYQKRKTLPGIQTVWRGMARLMDMIIGYELCQKAASSTCKKPL